jgi:hypothetical protein
MKGKPTVRHELKRIDSKQARAAEDAALRGDNIKLVHGMHWSVKGTQPPILDDVKQKGKKRPKKAVDYCPKRQALGEGNKRHYYIGREETVTSSYYDGTPYTHTYKWKECMYCKKGNRPRWRWWM